MKGQVTTDNVKPTPKQELALDAIASHKYTLLAGGSRSGKTFIGCYVVVVKALKTRCRQAIVRFHFNDVKQAVGMDTLPKVLEIIGMPYTLNKSDWVVTFQNGSEIWLAGLDDKERTEKILGKEFTTIYFNEASQISYLAYTTALTRLAENSGQKNRVIIDCNPPEKTHWLYKMFVLGKQPDSEMELHNKEHYTMVQMNPTDNPYLSPDYINDVLESLPERQKRRFLYGEWLDKRQGSLFKDEHIERSRVSSPPQYLPYAVVGIDPAVTSTDESDETGIISVGRDATGDFYVLRDDSLKGTPSEWAGRVSDAYTSLKLDAAIYETNQGGDMVQHTIMTANPQIPCYGVRATRGKAVRAEPVVALYEQGKVHHVGYFPELEEEMTSWVPGDSDSPDRLDALVWAITYLMEKPMRSGMVSPYMSGSTSSSGGSRGGYSGASSRPPTFGGGWDRRL